MAVEAVKTLDDLLGEGVCEAARVLVRVDLNVAPRRGRITDDGRIRAVAADLSALPRRGRRGW